MGEYGLITPECTDTHIAAGQRGGCGRGGRGGGRLFSRTLVRAYADVKCALTRRPGEDCKSVGIRSARIQSFGSSHTYR